LTSAEEVTPESVGYVMRTVKKLTSRGKKQKTINFGTKKCGQASNGPGSGPSVNFIQIFKSKSDENGEKFKKILTNPNRNPVPPPEQHDGILCRCQNMG
jgi:hypothetical protein